MSVFGIIEAEKILQVNDKTRINVSQSFVSPDETGISMIEIDPDGSAVYYDVTSNKYLDWIYQAAGDYTITVRVTSTISNVSTSTASISVVTEADDKLFSTDQEIKSQEHDILNYLPKGKSSFKFKHRAAQERILSYLDEKRVWDINGNKLTKDAIVNIEEVSDWSKYMVLMMIFEDLSNAVDDVFFEKSLRYRNLMNEARNRAALRLDVNGDGVIETGEGYNLVSLDMIRR